MERNFYAANLHLNEFFGITMPEADFESIALHAWDHIGNKRFRTYKYRAKVVDCKLDLPCNVEVIDAVLRDGADHYRTDGVNEWTADMYNGNVEQYIEAYKTPTEFAYSSGSYLDYQQSGNTLHFKVDNIFVTIIYKGTLVDEVGLPSLNFKEIDAIAKYCAWVYTQKQAMMTKDQSTFQLSQVLRQQWQFACDDARTPIYLTQNDADNILNVMSSWDRKRFGLSFKMLR